jgi:hypothetical protein
MARQGGAGGKLQRRGKAREAGIGMIDRAQQHGVAAGVGGALHVERGVADIPGGGGRYAATFERLVNGRGVGLGGGGVGGAEGG